MNEGLLHSHFVYCSYCPDDLSQVPEMRSPPSADLPPGVTAVPALSSLCDGRESEPLYMHRLMHKELPPQRYATPFDTPEFMKPSQTLDLEEYISFQRYLAPMIYNFLSS
jgi:hypothetical protein